MRQTTVDMVEVVPAKGPSYKVTLEYATALIKSGYVVWDSVDHKRVYEKYIAPSLIPKMGPRGPEVTRQIPVKRRK